jgi:hypothetical protein
MPRTFTVSAVNDTIDEDPVEIDHITHTVSTSDSLYAALPVPTVAVDVTDDDPVVRLTQTDGITHVSEFGTTDTFTIVLEGPPAAPLQINLVTDEGQVTTSPSSVTFDSTNFSTPRVVTVSAVDDEVDEVSPHYDVVRTVAPGTGPRSVLVEIDDNDPEVAGSAQAANPLGRTSGATEALFRAQCLTGGIIVGQGLDGYVIGMPRPDPEGLLVPTGPNAGSADFDVYFYDQGCNRLSSGDFAEAGPGRNELGRIPASARWAVVNYIAGSGPGSFTFRY